METTTNGHQPVVITEAIIEPSVKGKPARKPRTNQNNKWVDVAVTIDAGAKYVKALVNSSFHHFPSTYRVADGALPLMLMGCFTWNGDNYACGATAEMVEGSLERASNANKIDRIHIWLLGALTHSTGLLAELKAAKRRKNEPVRIRLDVTMLTLSSALESQIRASLEAIDFFIWESQQYKVAIKNLKILPEGYGSALAAIKDKPELKRFHVLDLGGGTLTLTEYLHSSVGRPAPVIQRIANGGGMNSIVTSIHIGLSKRDQSGTRILPELIQESLKASSDKECMYLFGNKPKNIASSVKSAMDDWLADNPQCFNILSFALAALLRDESVFLTGGGFGCSIVTNWIVQWLNRGSIGKGSLVVLDDCYRVNLLGINQPDLA